MSDVVRCKVICFKKNGDEIIGMKIKCPQEDEAYYSLEQIYELQLHQPGKGQSLPKETRGGIQDFFVKTTSGGTTLMLIERIDGKLQIARPDINVINVPDCD